MGKPTGFLDYAREPVHERPHLERIRDWEEMHFPLAEQTLREQAGRCMDCAVPFCHTGKLFDGMASGCPVNNFIPEWNDLVWRGQWKEAASDLAKAVASDPANVWDWLQLASVLVESGDVARYRDHRQAMLARFGD